MIYTDFAFSKATKHNWSGVFGYRPETQGLTDIYGEMFAVMSISTSLEFDLTPIGNLLFDELQDVYFSTQKQKITFNDFESALHKVKGRLELILDREKELSQVGIDLELGVLVVKEGALYGAIVGDSKIFILRDSNFAEIGESFIDPESDGFMRSGSLVLAAGDKLLLSTKKYGAKEDDELRGMVDKFKFPKLNSGTGAALLVGYELSEDPKMEEEPEVVEEVAAEVATVMPEMPDDESEDLEPQMTVREEEMREELPSKEKEANDNEPKYAYDDDITGMDFEMLPEDDVMVEEEPAVGGWKKNLMHMKDGLTGKATVFAGSLSKKLSKGVNTAQARFKPQDESYASELNQPMRDESEMNEEITPDLDMSGTSSLRNTDLSKRVGQVTDRAKNISAGLFQNAKSMLSNKPGDRTMYLRNAHHSKVKWKSLSILAVIIFIVLFLIVRKRNEELEIARQLQAVQDQIAQLSTRWEDVKVEAGAASIGEVSATKQEKAVTDIDEVISTAQGLLEKNVSTSELQDIIDQAQNSKDEVLNIRGFTEPQLIADLGSSFQGATPSAIAFSNNAVFVTDPASNSIYRMSTSLKSEVATLTTSLTSPYLMTTDKKGDLVVIDQNADSVVATVSAGNGQVKRSPGVSLAREGKLVAIDIYDTNSALYAVSAAKTSLYKQENVNGNFGVPNDSSPWRKDSDFAKAKDMAVDYSVFVLIDGKGILRYAGGAPATYKPSGFLPTDEAALKKAVAFELTPTKLYIADPANKRVIICTRKDENTYLFKEQFVYRGTDDKVFTEIKDIAVNEATNKIFVLDGTRVIRLDM